MTVRDLMTKLIRYNPNAQLHVIAHNYQHNFTLTFGGGEGVTPENADRVDFYVDDLCSNESQHLNKP